METIAALRSSVGISCSPLNPAVRSVVSTSTGPDLVRFGSTPLFSSAWIRKNSSIFHVKTRHRSLIFGVRRSTAIRVSLSPESGDSTAPIAPLKLESPIGQFLSQILVSHPHLVPAAVEQQLEQLQTDCNTEKRKEKSSASGTDLVLYRRIAEVKANERRKALEEILYALVVLKFMDVKVSLVPAITTSSSEASGRIDTWPCQDDKIERLHSPEAYDMIQNHLSLILGDRAGDSSSLAQIRKLRVGQVYAASVMYGYFLKRVDERFQLEKTMKILPKGSDDDEESSMQPAAGEETPGKNLSEDDTPRTVQSLPQFSSWSGRQGIKKSSRLRNYVMSFDGESLQRYATIRTREAVSIIEKHTEALFGRPEAVITREGAIDDSSKDEIIKISFGGLRRLILEAVTFGSFLWDVESSVDSRYSFVF